MNPKPDNASPDKSSLGNLESSATRGYPKGKLEEPDILRRKKIFYGPLGGIPDYVDIPWPYMLRILLFICAAVLVFWKISQYVGGLAWYRALVESPGLLQIIVWNGQLILGVSALIIGWVILCILLPPSPYPVVQRILLCLALNGAIWLGYLGILLVSITMQDVKLFGYELPLTNLFALIYIPYMISGYNYVSRRIQDAFSDSVNQ